MKIIVVTGSTRGIGFGLAGAFLELGCAVTVNGRTAAGVDQAVAKLAEKHGPGMLLGFPGDVTKFEQVQALWDAAHRRFGCVDIWINNAGISHAQSDLWNQPREILSNVVNTNLLGTMYGAKVALTGMLAQGFGSLYNMEGLGSDGRKAAGLALYGCTKRAVRYLTESLAQETRDTPVLVGSLSPGMVVTDLITAQYKERPPEDWENARRIFNILADRVETVTPWLAQKVLENDKNGARIQWLTRTKVISRLLLSALRKRDVFGETS